MRWKNIDDKDEKFDHECEDEYERESDEEEWCLKF